MKHDRTARAVLLAGAMLLTVTSAWAKPSLPGSTPPGPGVTPATGHVPIGVLSLFSSPDVPITIPDATAYGSLATNGVPATNYPSTNLVSGIGTSINFLTVDVSLTHTFVGDLDMLLVGPTGVQVVLSMGNGLNTGSPSVLTFSDAGAPLPSFATPIPTGIYHPFDNQPALLLYGVPAPPDPNNGYNAPGPGNGGLRPATTALAAFNGTNPNGTWNLYVIDRGVADIGVISGWTLAIDAATVPVELSMFQID